MDVIGPELDARPQIGLHRALRVRRDEDETARRRRLLRQGRCRERDARRADVVPEHRTQLVVAYLADIAGLAAQRGDAGGGIGGRAAGDLDARPHRRIEQLRLLGVDQRHRPLGEAIALEKIVIGFREHIDDRIANAHDVVIGLSHEGSRSFRKSAKNLHLACRVAQDKASRIKPLGILCGALHRPRRPPVLTMTPAPAPGVFTPRILQHWRHSDIFSGSFSCSLSRAS
jgi:hypothetical protein